MFLNSIADLFFFLNSFWHTLSLLPGKHFPSCLSWQTPSGCYLSRRWGQHRWCLERMHGIWPSFFQLFNRYLLKDYNVPTSCLRLWGFSREQDKQEPRLHGARLLYRIQWGRQIMHRWKNTVKSRNKSAVKNTKGNPELDKGAALDTGKKRSLWTGATRGTKSDRKYQEKVYAGVECGCLWNFRLGRQALFVSVLPLPPSPPYLRESLEQGDFLFWPRSSNGVQKPTQLKLWSFQRRRNNYTIGQNKWENWLLMKTLDMRKWMTPRDGKQWFLRLPQAARWPEWGTGRREWQEAMAISGAQFWRGVSHRWREFLWLARGLPPAFSWILISTWDWANHPRTGRG